MKDPHNDLKGLYLTTRGNYTFGLEAINNPGAHTKLLQWFYNNQADFKMFVRGNSNQLSRDYGPDLDLSWLYLEFFGEFLSQEQALDMAMTIASNMGVDLEIL